MSASSLNQISGAQCRAARALTEVSRAMLSERSGVAENTIRDFEKKIALPDSRDNTALMQALEGLGALFIADDLHGGHGVRLKFNAAESARIDRLENEGGQAAEDDVTS
jgi:hypothetical protein